MDESNNSHKTNKQFLSIAIVFGIAAILLTSSFVFFNKSKVAKKRCSTKLNTKILEESLKLGTDFLINGQTESGNFIYEYNWRKKTFTPQDSQVRQAGATWGLALINQYSPKKKTKDALLRALKFMNDHSVLNKAGERFIAYPGERTGKTGTVALVALAHLDLLAANNITDYELKTIKEFAGQYLKFLIRARTPNGHWHRSYNIVSGRPSGPPSPYFDGEALLALVKAVKYHGFDQRWKSLIIESSVNGYKDNVIAPGLINKDSKIIKGYYQWASMAFYEISQTDWEDSAKFGDYVISLANWMIDVHHTLKRRRNTAYAYEGIIHAYALALQRGDDFHMEKFSCTIDKGLEKLTSWQVGHSISNKSIRSRRTLDKHAVGGVQNHKHKPELRIDVTQHQMHAVILALRYHKNRPNW